MNPMAKLHKASSYSDLIETFNNTNRYLDDIYAFNNLLLQIRLLTFFWIGVNCRPFLDWNVPVAGGKIKTKMYKKTDDLSSFIVNFPFLDGDVPSPWLLHTMYIFLICMQQCFRFYLCISSKLLNQEFRYQK